MTRNGLPESYFRSERKPHLDALLQAIEPGEIIELNIREPHKRGSYDVLGYAWGILNQQALKEPRRIVLSSVHPSTATFSSPHQVFAEPYVWGIVRIPHPHQVQCKIPPKYAALAKKFDPSEAYIRYMMARDLGL